MSGNRVRNFRKSRQMTNHCTHSLYSLVIVFCILVLRVSCTEEPCRWYNDDYEYCWTVFTQTQTNTPPHEIAQPTRDSKPRQSAKGSNPASVGTVFLYCMTFLFSITRGALADFTEKKIIYFYSCASATK